MMMQCPPFAVQLEVSFTTLNMLPSSFDFQALPIRGMFALPVLSFALYLHYLLLVFPCTLLALFSLLH